MDDGGGRGSPRRQRADPGGGFAGARDMESLLSMVLDEPRGRTASRRDPVASPWRMGHPPADVGALTEAVLHPDRHRRDEVVEHLRALGVPDEAVVEVHVPAAARRLGEMWLDDTASFVEVTMAVASLQGLVRDLAPRPDPVAGAQAPLVAMVVRDRETHTLGASVAAARLRRGGASVMLLMGRPDGQVVEAMRGADLSAICVSASGREDLAGLAGLIGRMRAVARAPVLLGGSILEGDGSCASLRVATGADHVTADPGTVLRLCGLEAAGAPR